MRYVVMYRDERGKLRLVRRMDDRRKAAVFFSKASADRLASHLNGEAVEIETYSERNPICQ